MNKTFLKWAVLIFVLLPCSPIVAQQRWFENGTTSGSYKRVQWENVAYVIFYNPTAPIGAEIFIFAEGKFGPWGAIPQGSNSLTRLKALIDAKKDRWIKTQPYRDGAYLRPNAATGFADISRITSLRKETLTEFGQEAYVLFFENTISKSALIDADGKARMDKMINDSVVP